MKYGEWTMGQTEALINILGGLEVAKSLIAQTAKATIELIKLLCKVFDPAPVPGTEEFVITEEFLKKEFNIRWFGDNFKKLFFGKKCAATTAGTVGIYALQKNSQLKPVHDELGKNAIIELGQILWFISQQIKGAEGKLRVDGWANFGFVEVKNEEGKLEIWAVNFNFDGDYWSIYANPLAYSNVWSAERRFLVSGCCE